VTFVGGHLRSFRRRSSLADEVGFEVMRRRGLRRAPALDGDFARGGFEPVPSG
jgi:hypothetical protein